METAVNGQLQTGQSIRVPLSRQQVRLLRLLAAWRGPDLPRLSLLAGEMGLRDESAVRYHIGALEEAGLVERVAMGAGLPKIPRLTAAGTRYLEENPPAVPMFGPAHAGDCGVQYDEPVRHIRELRDLFPLWSDEYFLPIRGNCMEGGQEPIRAGDVVLLRPCSRLQRPPNGSIAHVELALDVNPGENEPLLRMYFYDEDTQRVTLRCWNPAPGQKKQESFDDADVEPRGVLVSVIRTYAVNGRK